MELRKCIICGNEFIGKKTKITCTPECMNKRYRQMQEGRQRKYYNKETSERTCKNCGKKYTGKRLSINPCCCRTCYIEFKGYYRICPVCDEKFFCYPSDNRTTCSPACSKIRRAELISKRRLPETAKEKISAAAKKKGLTDNLKKGTLAAQKSPRSGRFETNVSAKEWVLKSPDGKIYKCRNLRLWARQNCDLLGVEANEHNASNIAAGLTQAKRGMLGKKTATTCTYKGWIVIIENRTPS